MTAIVVDCSVAISWLIESETSAAGDAILDAVRVSGARVPELFWFEVANVMSLAVRRGRLTVGAVRPRLDLLAALPITTDAECWSRAGSETTLVALGQNLTVYDAAYLELALRIGAPLATFDQALRTAARSLGVSLLV
ncbi:MAG: type II toxin-antitoxin system VapC family toxin [Alphaproteobacteria bacterium]|nr:type II toxin-antitoxin system VapC family toxin [Alphaproteobacteria bacterium]